MEWFTAMNSQVELAEADPCRRRRRLRCGTLRSRCSRNFSASSASVSFDPISGMSRPLPQQIRHGADVVLMPVGEHQPDHVVQPVGDRIEPRQDQVHAGMVVLGEQHAAVDQQQLAAELEHRHVAADVAETAERDDAHRVRRQQGRASAS